MEVRCPEEATVTVLREMAPECPCIRGISSDDCCVLVSPGQIARIPKTDALPCRAFMERANA